MRNFLKLLSLARFFANIIRARQYLFKYEGTPIVDEYTVQVSAQSVKSSMLRPLSAVSKMGSNFLFFPVFFNFLADQSEFILRKRF